MINNCIEAMVKAMQELPPNDDNAITVVKAVIKILRDPSDEMIKAYDEFGHLDIEAYQAMIDVVLNEQ